MASAVASGVKDVAAAVKDKVSSSTTGSGSSGSVPRPQLKNLTRTRIPRVAAVGVLLCAASGFGWKLLVTDRHKRAISDFYKNFDPERDYARMKASGVFKTIGQKERPEWLTEYESEIDKAIEALKQPE